MLYCLWCDANSCFLNQLSLQKRYYRNPNVPGQKLKVQIPKNADMEKRRFVVSIPTPKVTEPVEIRDNNFSKAFREALFNYSNAFDEWCNAEGLFFFPSSYQPCFLFPGHHSNLSRTSSCFLYDPLNRRTQ